MESPELRHVVVHGHRRAYRTAGAGPVLLLVHGLGCDSTTWSEVIGPLAETHTVIAPDLLGHGESAKPDGDYSLGGYANGLRDLLTVLGIDKVTVVGHSLGGGVAMQFAYQFPERTERVVLVATGGLGREVHPLIRLLTVPGAGLAMRVATRAPLRPAVAASLRAASAGPLPMTRDLRHVARMYESFADPATLRAVRRVASHVLDWRGQFVTMTDRTYLAQLMPVLLVWGRQDVAIPVGHATRATGAAWTDVHVVEGAGHFPHVDHPEEFVGVVTEFIAAHPPAQHRRSTWAALLRRGDQALLTAVPEESPSDVVI